MTPPVRDPLAGFDLDALLTNGARVRPQRIALSDGQLDAPSALTFADLDALVSRTAAAWVAVGAQAGECVLIIAGARTAPLVALLGALRAGLDVALLPEACEIATLVHAANSVNAIALCAERDAVGRGFTGLMNAGAQIETVRVLAGLGDFTQAADADGIAPLELIAQQCATAPRAAVPQGAALNAAAVRKGAIVTFDDDGAACFHSQRTLAAAALDFITRAGVLARSPILSTLAPARFAGLIAGPIAALVSGAPLVLHGPFNGAILVALVDSLGPSHLIAPGALLGPLSDSGLLDGPRLASVTLMGRCASPHDMADHPRPLLARPTRGPALLDLLAIGEQAAIAQVRQRDGAPAPIGATTHALSIDGANITAVSFERNARSNGAANIVLSGAAVSGAENHVSG